MMRMAIALALVGALGVSCGPKRASAQIPEPWGEAALFPGDQLAAAAAEDQPIPPPSPDRHTLIYPWFLDRVDGQETDIEGCYGWGYRAAIGVTASGMFLGPDTPNRVIFVDSDAPNPMEALDLRTTDATLGYELAPRLAFSAALGPLGVGEVVYFGVDGWNSQARVSDGDFLQNNILGFQADDVTDLRLFYTAEMQSFESNLRFYDAPIGWGVLVGARYIEERERLNLSDRFTNRMGAAGVDTFRFATDNQMLGLQVGMDMALEEGPWRLDARLKAAVLGNDCRRVGEAIVPGIGTGMASFDVRDTRAAFMGEFNITGAYYVLPTVALTLGYQLMIFEGMAVATEQFNGPNASSNPFFNGGLVGVEVYR